MFKIDILHKIDINDILKVIKHIKKQQYTAQSEKRFIPKIPL